MTSRPGWAASQEQRVRTPPWATGGKREVRALFPAARPSGAAQPREQREPSALEAAVRQPDRRGAEVRAPTPAPVPTPPPQAAPQPPAPRPELVRAVEGLERAASALHDEVRRFREAAPLEVLDLAMVVAREILGAEPALPARGKLEAALGEALQSLGAGPLVVRVHPNDVDVVDELRKDRGDLGALEVFLDPALARGDVVVESGLGRVDATRATRLHNIERKLRAVVTADAQGGDA